MRMACAGVRAPVRKDPAVNINVANSPGHARWRGMHERMNLSILKGLAAVTLFLSNHRIRKAGFY